MSSINNFFRRLKERPSLYFILLALITAFSAIEAYNPIIKNYGSFSHVAEENYVGKLSGWLVKAGDFFSDGSKAVYYILFALLILLLFSAISALFFSGYANKLLLSVEGKRKTKGEFTKGVTQKFFKTLLYIYSAVVLSVVFYFLIIYSAVPVFFRINQLTEGNAEVIFSALIMGLLTLVVIFFALVFYCMYFSYILPAISGLKKGAILAGFRMTNTYVWYLLPKTLMFMFGEALIRTVLFIIHYGHSSLEMSLIVLFVTSLLRSILYFVYLYFTFNTFVAMREDLYPEYGEGSEEADLSEDTEHVSQPVKTVRPETNKEIKMNVEQKQRVNTINDNNYVDIGRYTRTSKIENTESPKQFEDDINTISDSDDDISFVSHKAPSNSRRSRVVSRPLEETKKVVSQEKVQQESVINLNDVDDIEDDYDDSF